MADPHICSVHALPLPSQSYPIFNVRGKRKRRPLIELDNEEDDGSNNEKEYLAVITPEERVQRRLAGQPMDVPPPPAPFPHSPQSRASTLPDENSSQDPVHVARLDSAPSLSLRNRHLAVMMAILHKSLEQREYVRAAKVVAMVLRTEVSGRTIDLRHTGLWNIAAEILMRRSDATADHRVSRQGFERAKIFYNKLALQNPWHRTWPNAINAQDFKIAMFDLWIYTVCRESQRVRQQHVDHDGDPSLSHHEIQVKRWELAEAHSISREMDSLLATVPFLDQLELIRLRAMVALWTADLIDAVDTLAADAESDDSLREPALQQPWSADIEDYHASAVQSSHKEAAAAARELAESLFAKLGEQGSDKTMGEDEDMVQ